MQTVESIATEVKPKVKVPPMKQIDDLEMIHFSNTQNPDGTYRFNAILKDCEGEEFEYAVNVPANALAGFLEMVTKQGKKGFSAVKVKRTYLQAIWVPDTKMEEVTTEEGIPTEEVAN